MSKAHLDRHVDEPMVVYPLRLAASDLEQIRLIAKKEDRTRQSLIRKAVSEFLERRKMR